MIIKHTKQSDFTQIKNNAINDTRLSWQAKGVLLYLISKPADWQVYEVDIVKHATNGRDSVRKCLKELIDCGYIIKNRLRNEKGSFAKNEYIVDDIPSKPDNNPIDWKPVDGKPNDGKSPTSNIDITNKELTNTNNKGILSNSIFLNTFDNQGIVNVINTYMTDLYIQRTNKKHPDIKQLQYKRIYAEIEYFMGMHNCLEIEHLEDIMISYLNSDVMKTDYNINHFASYEIMLNRARELGYETK